MNLTDEQLHAMTHGKGPGLVLAVPGSGKTTMLLNRTKRLMDEGVDRKNILTITFSRASARDLSVRYKNLFANSSPPAFSTIHSFCYSVLKNDERRRGVRYTLIESDRAVSKWRMLSDLWKEIMHRSPNEEQMENLLREISYVKNKVLDPAQYNKEAITPLFLTFFTRYEELKRARHWIDFDDMITLVPEIFKQDPGLLASIRNTYDYIQVDEGQDTSKGQLAIIESIAKPKNNLFIVADDDQSIYGFRGADFRELLHLKDRYADLSLYYLSKNFRSQKNILSLSAQFIKQNKTRYEKTPVAVKGTGPEVRTVELNSLDRQYAFIASEIEKYDLKDVAILYRNHVSSIGLVEFFERKNIPFTSKERTSRFFHHWVLQDLMSIYEFSQNPGDLASFSTFYYKIRGYLSKNMIESLQKRGVGTSVFDSLLSLKLPDYMLRDVKALKRDFQHLKTLAPAEAFRFIQKDLEYEEYISNHASTFGSSKTTSLRILYYAKYIARKTDDYDQFIGRLRTLDRLMQGSRAGKQGLVLSTLHGAKGLEFDAVFLVDLNADTIPSMSGRFADSKEEAQQLEEERRLFYVGMTRAKTRLYLLRSTHVDRESVAPSEFFTWAKEAILAERKNNRIE
ncbi:MAG: ATP-dependent helicase [Peptoniphilus sp.]|nr:ATP-dependent helicase [Peptoniphilus sp.]MDY3118702.1 ATP-dependent helicase [Peptoniphilus sp.]